MTPAILNTKSQPAWPVINRSTSEDYINMGGRFIMVTGVIRNQDEVLCRPFPPSVTVFYNPKDLTRDQPSCWMKPIPRVASKFLLFDRRAGAELRLVSFTEHGMRNRF